MENNETIPETENSETQSGCLIRFILSFVIVPVLSVWVYFFVNSYSHSLTGPEIVIGKKYLYCRHCGGFDNPFDEEKDTVLVLDKSTWYVKYRHGESHYPTSGFEYSEDVYSFRCFTKEIEP